MVGDRPDVSKVREQLAPSFSGSNNGTSKLKELGVSGWMAAAYGKKTLFYAFRDMKSLCRLDPCPLVFRVCVGVGCGNW